MKRIQNFLRINHNVKRFLFLTTGLMIVIAVLSYKVNIAYSATECGCDCGIEGCTDKGSEACERVSCQCGCSICDKDQCSNGSPPCGGKAPCNDKDKGGCGCILCKDFCPEEGAPCGGEECSCKPRGSCYNIRIDKVWECYPVIQGYCIDGKCNNNCNYMDYSKWCACPLEHPKIDCSCRTTKCECVGGTA